MPEPVEILLVEDNPVDVELTLDALRENHIANNVHVASDGIEALEFLRSEGRYAGRDPSLPKLVLLDLNLPLVSGKEVLREIKSDPGLRTIPVVILTSSREERDLVESYALGVNSYIVKPVDFRQFVETSKAFGLYWLLLNELPNGNGHRDRTD